MYERYSFNRLPPANFRFKHRFPIHQILGVYCATKFSMSSKQCVKKFIDIPGPPRLPFIGSIHLYKTGKYEIRKYHKVLQDLYGKYGPIVRQDLGATTTIHVFEPCDIQTVYRNEGKSPHVAPLLDTAKHYREKNNLALGLGNTNGEEWYRLRSAIRKMMLRPTEVYYYLPSVQEIAKMFVKRLGEKRNSKGEVCNLSKEAGKWAMESAGLICFEGSVGSMNGGDSEKECEAMIDANQAIFEISAQLKFSLPVYKYISTPKIRKLIEAEDFFYRKSMEHINRTVLKVEKELRENKSLDGKYNFMAYLLSRKELSIQDVRIIAFSMFADGLSTTVPALLFNLYCLAANPEVQKTVFEEIQYVLGETEDITFEKLNNLPFLKATVKETFRFYPIGTEVSRITDKDLVLSGYEIPEGTQLDLTSNVHFMSEKYFKDAKCFRPDRWIKSRSQNNINPFILTPFGHGTRTCAGRRFAEQDLFVVLCTILQNFHLKLTHPKPLEQVYASLLFPDGPLMVQFIPRL